MCAETKTCNFDKILTTLHQIFFKSVQQHVIHPVKMEVYVCCLAFVFVLVGLWATAVNTIIQVRTIKITHHSYYNYTNRQ